MKTRKINFTDISFAVNYHAFINPHTSSKNLFPNYAFGFLILLLTVFACFNIHEFAYGFLIFANIIFLINFSFKLFLFSFYVALKPLKSEVCKPFEYPVYTILLPVYNEEKHVLEALVKSINDLNYPKEKLDVKFLLEEKDSYTFSNLSGIDHNFEVLIVPDFQPKTKPKACNFGLYYAKGEFLVIYDVEDKPEPDQLLKALNKFRNSAEKLICVQAMLNFYNTEKDWLPRCFAIEYLIWFNAFLPMLAKFNIFLPLGGTSNHFKTEKLIEIGGWDAYNVTEDAELGIRIKKKGYATSVIKSYTFEEAPKYIDNWLMQRTRWQKGFLQTFLVHIFDFKKSLKLGFLNFANIFLMVGLSFFSFFFIPLTIFFMFFIKDWGILKILFSFNMVSNLTYFMLFFYVAKRENFKGFEKTIFSIPFYFLFHVFSSILAFFEIFIKPFYWHKTKHGA